MFRILFAGILMVCAVIEAANTNEFVNPPPAQTHFDLSGNPIYKLGDNVHLQWATNYKRANLVVRQLNASNGHAIVSGSSFVKSMFGHCGCSSSLIFADNCMCDCRESEQQSNLSRLESYIV